MRIHVKPFTTLLCLVRFALILPLSLSLSFPFSFRSLIQYYQQMCNRTSFEHHVHTISQCKCFSLWTVQHQHHHHEIAASRVYRKYTSGMQTKIDLSRQHTYERANDACVYGCACKGLIMMVSIFVNIYGCTRRTLMIFSETNYQLFSLFTKMSR